MLVPRERKTAIDDNDTKILQISSRPSRLLKGVLLFFTATVFLIGIYTLVSDSWSNPAVAYHHDRTGHPNYRPPIKSKLHPGYLIRTSECQIPDFHPFHPTIMKYFEKHVEELNCADYPPLAYTIGKKLFVNKTTMEAIKRNNSGVKCCYRGLYRDKEGKHDDHYRYDKTCKPLDGASKAINLQTEFIRVECENKTKTTIYKSIHAVIIRKEKVEQKFKNYESKIKDVDRYNLLFLVMDTVSRLNFHRHMNRTKEIFIDRLGAIELKVYNKVGDNTFPNVIPLTTGLTVDELKKRCWNNDRQPLDRCKFVWSEIAKMGYRTLMAEDTPDIGTFNYLIQGFYKTPTDYYIRPAMVAAERETGRKKRMNCVQCVGSMSEAEFILKYTADFHAEFAKETTFAHTWINSLTHDFLNWPSRGDKLFAKFFEDMIDSGALNKTIVIFLSDHGIRWGGIVSTYLGRLEERLPFCFAYFPESFKKKYPEIIRNVKTNANRLVTPFDIYSTIQNVLNFRGKPRPSSDWIHNSTISSRSHSLFGEIPENRSCESASIPASWCCCHKSKNIGTDDPDVLNAAKRFVTFINEKIERFPSAKNKCAKLELSRVTSARVGVTSDSVSKKSDVSTHVKDYMLIVETKPGGAKFETTVRKDQNDYNVLGTIGRTNLYGDQSHCVDKKELKKFCYCRKQNQ